MVAFLYSQCLFQKKFITTNNVMVVFFYISINLYYPCLQPFSHWTCILSIFSECSCTKCVFIIVLLWKDHIEQFPFWCVRCYGSLMKSHHNKKKLNFHFVYRKAPNTFSWSSIQIITLFNQLVPQQPNFFHASNGVKHLCSSSCCFLLLLQLKSITYPPPPLPSSPKHDS
jgi:hypothetical protein